jgi:preprotein translocase subunit SecG
VFGARGSASFLSRMTAVLATLFFLTSLGLSYLFSQGSDVPTSVMDRVPEQQAPADPTAVPALPAPEAPAPSPAPETAAPPADQAPAATDE